MYAFSLTPSPLELPTFGMTPDTDSLLIKIRNKFRWISVYLRPVCMAIFCLKRYYIFKKNLRNLTLIGENIVLLWIFFFLVFEHLNQSTVSIAYLNAFKLTEILPYVCYAVKKNNLLIISVCILLYTYLCGYLSCGVLHNLSL